MYVFIFCILVFTLLFSLFFFFNATSTSEIYTLSLHDALPICARRGPRASLCAEVFSAGGQGPGSRDGAQPDRSEEHTSELQSHHDLVCRLLLEKKKKKTKKNILMNNTIKKECFKLILADLITT